MKKIYVRPVSEIYDAEMGEVICGASQLLQNGNVGGQGGQGPNDYDKNGPNNELTGGSDFGEVINTSNGPGSSAKEFDLWGDW